MGTLVGGKRHDAFVYRTFFDLEITTEEGTGLFTTRNRQGAAARRSEARSPLPPSSLRTLAPPGCADAKFDFIMPKAGRFTACVHNRGRHPTEVSLHTTVGWREKHDKLTAEHITPLRNNVGRLLGQLRLMAEEQTYLEARDRMLRATNESTATRAVMWALVEAAVLLTVSVAQVVAVKAFFSEKTSAGGVMAGLTSSVKIFGKSGSFGSSGKSKGLLGV